MGTDGSGGALDRLADELRRHGLDVVKTSSAGACLRVTNRSAPELTERIACRQSADGTVYFSWPWRQPIAPVGSLHEAVEKVLHVLATVDE